MSIKGRSTKPAKDKAGGQSEQSLLQTRPGAKRPKPEKDKVGGQSERSLLQTRPVAKLAKPAKDKAGGAEGTVQGQMSAPSFPKRCPKRCLKNFPKK